MGSNISQPVHEGSYGEERKPKYSPTLTTILAKPSLVLQSVNFIPGLGKRSQPLTPVAPQTPTVPQIQVEPAAVPELFITGPAGRTETTIDVNPVLVGEGSVTDLFCCTVHLRHPLLLRPRIQGSVHW